MSILQHLFIVLTKGGTIYLNGVMWWFVNTPSLSYMSEIQRWPGAVPQKCSSSGHIPPRSSRWPVFFSPFHLHPHCLTTGLCNMVKHSSAQKHVMHKTPLYTEVNEISWQNKIYHGCVSINSCPCQVTYGSSIKCRFVCFRVYVLGKPLKAPVTWNTALSECVSQMPHKMCILTVLLHLFIKLSVDIFRPDASLEEQCNGLL